MLIPTLGDYKPKLSMIRQKLVDSNITKVNQRNDYQSQKQRRTKVQIRPTFITKIGVQRPNGKFKTEYHKVSDHTLVTSHGTCFPNPAPGGFLRMSIKDITVGTHYSGLLKETYSSTRSTTLFGRWEHNPTYHIYRLQQIRIHQFLSTSK